MQRRDVSCRFPNGTFALTPLCEEKQKPYAKQECYNEKCKGTWKVGEWSEVSFICKYIWCVHFQPLFNFSHYIVEILFTILCNFE